MIRNILTLGFLFFSIMVSAQTTDSLKAERFSVHFQSTVIRQMKPAFHAAYSGSNSLSTREDAQTSLTSTLFLGLHLWDGASFYFNPELSGGSGLSGAVGVADALNGETYRIGNPAPQLSLARLYVRQLIALSDKRSYQNSDINQLGGWIPERYVSITIGKSAIADFFDGNKFSHDPRSQFMAWSLMDNGAWDYPANTHGYTESVILEYVSPTHELRYAASLLPKAPNGEELNWNIGKALSHSLEYTHKHTIAGQEGAIRLLGYFSTANMGSYRQSLVNPSDIASTRVYGHTKYGFGINAEQNITGDLGCFLRAGWNDGHNETWAFTEIDRTLSGGFVLTGQRWKRSNDNIGLAYVISGLSKDHRDFLQAGGYGFELGDGNLNYAPEQLAELYYSAEMKKDLIYLTAAYQLLFNPGYNKDRSGPVNVFSVRLHIRM
ncbi:carbohydrate porin [Paludibacter sp.]|uniref:carbohydrate porin n=1 Tax=Paludibacter sp. TaxID=1898105 RepID=UPI0026013A16|nr:carbohydrate porin [Paludibacter sp.]